MDIYTDMYTHTSKYCISVCAMCVRVCVHISREHQLIVRETLGVVTVVKPSHGLQRHACVDLANKLSADKTSKGWQAPKLFVYTVFTHASTLLALTLCQHQLEAWSWGMGGREREREGGREGERERERGRGREREREGGGRLSE